MLGTALWRELRIRARHVVGPVLGVTVLVYIVYHGLHGDRGLIAWRAYEQRVVTAQQELTAVEAEREALSRQAMLLHPQSLDPDMLDEWARRLLNFGRPDEIVIFPRDEAKRAADE